MSIDAADLRRLLKIVHQYEVIYGGGISSGDAAVREECESLLASLEKEISLHPISAGLRARRKKADADSLPSLMDAGKIPRAEKSVRPMTARTSELVQLTAIDKRKTPPKNDAKVATSPKPTAAGKLAEKKAVEKTQEKKTPEKQALLGKSGKEPGKKAAENKVVSGGKAAKAAIAPPAKESVPAGKQTRSQHAESVASKGKQDSSAPPETRSRVTVSANEPDLRSRNLGAARAAEERAEKALGSADNDATAEPKRRFAALHLFDAFKQNKLPKYGGFIVCVRFAAESGYGIVEIIGYENLQDIYPEGNTLVFKSVGCKLYAIVEPASYLLKSVEPVNRPSEQMVPYRFAELLRITTKRFQNILVGRKPVFMPTSFSVLKPSGEDLSVLFYDMADVYTNIQDFIIMLLRDRMNIPVPDSRKAGEIIARGIREFHLWLDEA